MAKVYLLTDQRYVAPQSPDWYTQQILDEDALLIEALRHHNISCERVDWADPQIDWTLADAAVFRTTWDYFDRYPEFERWMSRVKEEIQLINPHSLIKWNLDKHYLQDLEARGFDIVPSIFIEQGELQSLEQIALASDWEEMILKPCISGGARHTYRFKRGETAALEAIFGELIKDESMMLQEFHATIIEKGEVSHMVLGGEYTHSVLKQSKGTDFRVQDDFGGSVHPYVADEDERALAEAVFASCSPVPVYGRLDIMWDSSGKAMISELEIIEPELWLREHAASALPFAAGIASAIENRVS